MATKIIEYHTEQQQWYSSESLQVLAGLKSETFEI